ncbi:MAG: methyl-accepting chemotaxis protein [Lachnospiraceae bacterium]|nr:methyl-accepting chemotaxis protein [Lachnospiraceae bacterium]
MGKIKSREKGTKKVKERSNAGKAAKVKKTETNVKAAKKTVGLLGIRNKIYICFIIPIAFMALIGYASYLYSERGLDDSFSDASTQTISMAMDYLDMSNTFIQSEGMKYMVDPNIESYAVGMPRADKVEKTNYYKNQRVSMMSTQISNNFIRDIHIITKSAYNMMTTVTADKLPGVYDEYLDSLEEAGADRSNLPNWVSSHKVVDDALSIDSDGYFYSYQIQNSTRFAYIILDIDKEAVLDILRGMDFGEGSIVGVVTADGAELSYDCDLEAECEAPVFASQDFYTQVDEETLNATVKYNGKDYLYICKESGLNGMTMNALIPQATVTKQAQGIKLMTVVLILIAGVIATVIGTVIANGIQNNMKRISSKLDEVAGGDLTVAVSAKGHDEFQFLARSASNMIDNNKKLIFKLSDTAENLQDSARGVNDASLLLSDFSGQINRAIEEINSGVARQEAHAGECIDVTGQLSVRIGEIMEDVEAIREVINDTVQRINEGTDIVNNLAEKAEETSRLSSEVATNILDLQKDANSINEFVETINSISSQTNLLSLNASIEAARAGDAGRGFAVVAGEIRNLADNSSAATVEISNKITNIDQHSMLSVESARNAETVVNLQKEAVSDVINVFDGIRDQMTVLSEALKKISDSASLADEERKEAVDSVNRISEIISSTSESSSKVDGIASSLMGSVEDLGRTADILNGNMQGLKEEIASFRVN